MKSKLLIITGIFIIPFVIPHTFGAYVEFDDGDYKLFLNNEHVVEFRLDWSPDGDLSRGEIIFDEPINDTILLQIPKNIPRTTNLDFGHFGLYAIHADESWVEIRETDSECFYILEIPVNDSDYVEIVGVSVATGRWEPVTIQNEECDEIYSRLISQNGNIFPPHGYPAWKTMPPLKQIQNGIALFDVVCSDDKIPAYKHDNMHVACVSEETHTKLITRGWALLRFALPDENPSHVLCNRYDGKWHLEYFGCRDVTDNQCSLMGGVSVDNLRICYNGICPEKLYSLCVTNMNLDIQYPDETQEQYDDRCRQSDKIRGPGPGPVECQSDLIQCVSECGNDDIWHMFDKNGIMIDNETAKTIVKQNEN